MGSHHKMPRQISLTTEEIQRIKSQFITLDKNGDGEITEEEMRQALTDAGQDCGVQDIQKIMKKADKNCDGKVVWQEFLELMSDYIHKETSHERVNTEEKKEAI